MSITLIGRNKMTLDLVDYKEKASKAEVSSISDLKGARDKKAEEQSSQKLEFASRVENFPVSYHLDEQGEMKAQLSSKVMDHEARLRYDRVLQELSGGLSFDNLPIETKNRYICMARIVCQCINAPDWLLKAAGEDLEFCYMLGGRLLEHESRFFRYSSGKNEEHQSKPRFSIG